MKQIVATITTAIRATSRTHNQVRVISQDRLRMEKELFVGKREGVQILNIGPQGIDDYLTVKLESEIVVFFQFFRRTLIVQMLQELIKSVFALPPDHIIDTIVLQDLLGHGRRMDTPKNNGDITRLLDPARP